MEELTSGEEELRLLVETIPALVWRAGPEGNIEYVNKRVLEYLGKPLSEIIGWGWMESVHPDDVTFKERTWLKNLETETPHNVVCRFRGADGQYRWFEVRGEPLRASVGTVLSWYGVLIDIDDRKKLQATLNVIPAHTWYAAPSGGLTFVNKRTADYLGLPEDHPLRSGIDIDAPWDAHIQLLHPTTAKNHVKPGQPACGRARPLRLVSEFLTLRESTAGSSVAPNRSERTMARYGSGSG